MIQLHFMMNNSHKTLCDIGNTNLYTHSIFRFHFIVLHFKFVLAQT